MGTMQICGTLKSIWELCKSVGFYVLSDENTEICGKKSEKGDR